MPFRRNRFPRFLDLVCQPDTGFKLRFHFWYTINNIEKFSIESNFLNFKKCISSDRAQSDFFCIIGVN